MEGAGMYRSGFAQGELGGVIEHVFAEGRLCASVADVKRIRGLAMQQEKLIETLKEKVDNDDEFQLFAETVEGLQKKNMALRRMCQQNLMLAETEAQRKLREVRKRGKRNEKVVVDAAAKTVLMLKKRHAEELRACRGEHNSN